jgi:hypothetical protein
MKQNENLIKINSQHEIIKRYKEMDQQQHEVIEDYSPVGGNRSFFKSIIS